MSTYAALSLPSGDTGFGLDSPSSSGSGNSGLVLGLILAAIITFLLAVVMTIIARRKRQRLDGKEPGPLLGFLDPLLPASFQHRFRRAPERDLESPGSSDTDSTTTNRLYPTSTTMARARASRLLAALPLPEFVAAGHVAAAPLSFGVAPTAAYIHLAARAGSDQAVDRAAAVWNMGVATAEARVAAFLGGSAATDGPTRARILAVVGRAVAGSLEALPRTTSLFPEVPARGRATDADVVQAYAGLDGETRRLDPDAAPSAASSALGTVRSNAFWDAVAPIVGRAQAVVDAALGTSAVAVAATVSPGSTGNGRIDVAAVVHAALLGVIRAKAVRPFVAVVHAVAGAPVVPGVMLVVGGEPMGTHTHAQRTVAKPVYPGLVDLVDGSVIVPCLVTAA
ncbi:hypothetical protein H9P43_001950 [Blastocladiella emersonii ATCC 22665]|nr:hypothetical protein H9P43_001950 [Blastocladiella emersonii ATCC 22665]